MKEVFIITRERHGAKEYLCSVRGEEFWFNDHKIVKTYPSYTSAAAVLQAREVPHTEIDINTLYGIDKKFVVE